ncbi:MAG: acetyltransferase [Gammaproteobacteria bacterium]|nr:acetyltransferase [Gammaproteobacteria bacterium]
MRNLLIAGAGGHGVVVADAAELTQEWGRIHFVDDVYPKVQRIAHWDIIGASESLLQLGKYVDAAVVAIGNVDIRMRLIASVEAAGIPLTSVIHPRAAVSRLARIDAGTVLLANAAVNARAKIGKGCIVNTAATVDHDCWIEDGVHIAPGAHLAADVKVGQQTWIGAGATVREQITIGKNAVIGAGAAVVKDVADNQVVVGVPAKPIHSKTRLQVMRGSGH